ncbi:GNAT family N-acetyltransferase [Halobacillus sp. Marseille-P3879]|uniref:GNAT family N-acetyltransferase n=1 Tax=Halobacillus sp. Marseille-P3879 TaxID=2045014 RepID=UPI000C79E64B|nr:GNAT family N-acetyltransferase [Halobacillus sp. Marseille-P3879]
MYIRNMESEDYHEVSSIINDWWRGRNMSLPRLFFEHFQNTSYIIKEDNKIIGFLIGFLSQSYPDEAYIHFAGIHPDYRREGLGKKLYQLFFGEVRQHGVSKIRCITSIENRKSIAYHTQIGFKIIPGDKTVEDIRVHSDYGGEGVDRVLFLKELKGK